MSIGTAYLAAMAAIVAVAIGICLYLAIWQGHWFALAILALPALWIVMWLTD